MGTGRWRSIAALVLCSLAVTIKMPAIVALGYLAIRGPKTGTRRWLDITAAAIISTTTLHLAGMLTGYGWEWAKNLFVGPRITSYLSPATLIAALLQWMSSLAGMDTSFAGFARPLKLLGVMSAFAAIWWFLRRSPRLGLAALSSALIVLAVFGPAVQPWYLTWGWSSERCRRLAGRGGPMGRSR